MKENSKKGVGNMKKSIVIWMILFNFVILTACSKTEEKGLENENTDGVESGDIYPLTGLPADGADRNNRVVGVMVNNQLKARQQSGLTKADIVFEILAEGDITRFLALYQSEQPEIIGPVRSAREYYFKLAEGYEAIYVYHGAAGFVDKMIKDQKIENLNGAIYDNDKHLFKRESFRKAPHNSYLQFDAVYEVAKEKGYDTTYDYAYEALPFISGKAETSGDSVDTIDITYAKDKANNVQFKYNDGRFSRYSNGEQTVELDGDEPVEVDNVFVVEAEHTVFDDEGRRKINLDRGGKAFLFQKGTVQVLEWENQNGRIVPVKDGRVVGFVPGKTWINIVPTNPGMKQSVTY